MELINQEYKALWSKRNKLLFQFVFSYFSLYIILLFLNPVFESPFRWIGNSILGFNYDYDVSGNGSGDHTYAYITLFINVVLTFIIVGFWALLDRNRKNYNKLLYWFFVVLRFFLIGAMFLYGFVKIFKLQFPSASLTHLLDPLGDFSPMGLAWTYMGFSKGFNVFVGFMEVLGGLLLIPRRTQTLGSFIIIGVMTQVAMMNFCYDIPVKLFSIHLILIALVIFMTDIKRFLNVFIKNESVEKQNHYHPIKSPKYHNVIFWIKSIGLIVIIGLMSFNFYTTESHRGNKRIKPNLYGIWEASYFVKNGDTLQPLITDTYRWRYLIVDFKDVATVKTMDDTKHHYTFISDSASQKITIYKAENKSDTLNFNFLRPNSNSLELNGKLENDSLKIIFSKKDLNDFKLNSRGFHWINERPYNR
jgi:hypothetical protein